MSWRFKTRVAGGALRYAWLTARHGGYKGAQLFYAAALDGDPWASVFLADSGIGALAASYAYQHDAPDRLTTELAAVYADSDLSGYGATEYDKGGATLRDQQRGLLLPHLNEALSGFPANSRVVEVGTGNGDVIAHVATNYPSIAFTGIDFNTENAQAKHGLPNLTFETGYALDLLDNNQFRSDLIFASSTFCLFTPGELRAYITAFAGRGMTVVLNEPTWGPYGHRQDRGAFSRHLEGQVWHHDYAGYLAEVGYRVTTFDPFPYTHPRSRRPDINVLVLAATRNV